MTSYQDQHAPIKFYLFCQNIPLGKLIQEKIIQGSNELFKGQINQNFDIFSFNPIYLLCD